MQIDEAAEATQPPAEEVVSAEPTAESASEASQVLLLVPKKPQCNSDSCWLHDISQACGPVRRFQPQRRALFQTLLRMR